MKKITSKKSKPGLQISRFFSTAGRDPFSEVEWERRDAVITGEGGKVYFEQKDVEFPKTWSQLATNVVVQKYFRGAVGTPTRERSVRQLIGRVASTLTGWGRKDGYFRTEQDAEVFRDELTHLLIHQKMAFNSPVWFNVGVEPEPQCSACFINSVQDTMDSILTLAKTEGMLFKFGSGTGTNFSSIRSSRESLQGGGGASGPVSFMKGFDAFAGVIKSGGKCLAPDQKIYTAEEGPVAVKDLAARKKDFLAISYDPPLGRFKIKPARAWKEREEKEVVRVLTDKGKFDLSFDHPVKLSTGEYVEAGKLKPGMSLFAGSIDESEGYPRLHLKNGEKGKEFIHRLIASDVLCLDTRKKSVHHKDGNKLNNVVGNLTVVSQADHAVLHHKEMVEKGIHLFQTKTYPKKGVTNGMHSSRFFADPSKSQPYREAKKEELVKSGRARSMQDRAATQKMINTAWAIVNNGGSIETFEEYVEGRKLIGRPISTNLHKAQGRIEKRFGSYGGFLNEVRSLNHSVLSVQNIGKMEVYDVEVDCPTEDDKTPQSGHNFLIWDGEGRFGSGVVVSNTRRAAKMVILNADHPDILEYIHCKANEEKKAWALIDAGYDGSFNGEAYNSIFFQNSNNSVRVTDSFMESVVHDRPWQTKSVTRGEVVDTYRARDIWRQVAEAAHQCGDPGLQFDTTVNSWHPCPNSGRINASNPCCFTADTLVDTSEGPLSFAHLMEMSNQGEPFPCAWSFDRNAELPVLRSILKVWEAGRTNKLILVETEKGHRLRCTPEHRFLLSDKNPSGGGFVEAQKLLPGMILQHRIRSFRKPSPEGVGNKFEDRVKTITSLTLEEEVSVYDMEVEGTHNFGVLSPVQYGDALLHSIIVHNSEYMFLDDSACNLASLNLRKFQFPVGHPQAGDFDIDSFEHAVDLTILAQEILVDNARYPTEKIGQNSHLYRPLGLGYANLGALLMSRGLPYDSDAGRAYAGALTALMGGRAYRMSAEIAENHGGPFAGYEKNREPFLGVMRKHRQHVDHIDSALCPQDLLLAAKLAWEEAILFGERYGFRNGQATVLAPTGTIGFMMDCDTTGIEPDIALVKYKRLVGGGLLKITNQTVAEALTRLGYDAAAQKQITDYIAAQDTIEGAPGLRPEHLSVFDCAFRAQNGTRSIHPMGHIKMMAAAQPFISGAISKTVNLPGDATIEDIENAYMEAWRLGLKAIAIYRDGCKRSQPLSTSKTERVEKTVSSLPVEVQREIQAAVSVEDLLGRIANLVKPTGQPMAVRRRLPAERHSLTHKFEIAGHDGYLHVGMYEDGSPGEIFIRMAKEGSTISGLMDSFATAVSIALQHGVPLRLLVDKFSRTRFEPSGWTGNSEIPRASSVMDYLFRWLETKFPSEALTEKLTGASEPDSKIFNRPYRTESETFNLPYRAETDAPMCSECGSMMVRSGTCHRCTNCGSTSGCG